MDPGAGVGVGMGWASRPLSILAHMGNDTEAAIAIARIARQEDATVIVLGLPLERFTALTASVALGLSLSLSRSNAARK